MFQLRAKKGEGARGKGKEGVAGTVRVTLLIEETAKAKTGAGNMLGALKGPCWREGKSWLSWGPGVTIWI